MTKVTTNGDGCQGKICTRCGIWKLLEDFNRFHGAPGGRAQSCRECVRVSRVDRINGGPLVRQREEYKRHRAWLYDFGLKKCSDCYEIKLLAEFSRNRSSLDKLGYKCKICINRDHRMYTLENPDRVNGYKKRWLADNLEQSRESARKTAKANRSVGRARWHRYHARKLAATVEYFLDIEIFERDNWICGICGEPIDRELKWPDVMSKSLDHVMPLSRGGEHSRSNTQAAHFVCNSAKGAR